MTPELKKKFETFLWDETAICDPEDMEIIVKWVDENIVSLLCEADKLNSLLKAENTDLLKSLELLGDENAQSVFVQDDNYHVNKKLKDTLNQAVEIIKQWRTKAAAVSGKSKEVIEEIWHTYFEHAPEMEGIREVLKDKL